MMFLIVVIATLIGVILSASIGANDVGNSFATAVGSKVLTIRQAVLIASVCEFSGAMLMGAVVSDTLRTGIIKDFLLVFRPGVDEQLYMLGTMCVLLGSTCWLVLATYLNMPVSTTHSIVGSIVGFVVTFKGYGAIRWSTIGYIALSWIISPLLGLVLAGPVSNVLSRFVLLLGSEEQPASHEHNNHDNNHHHHHHQQQQQQQQQQQKQQHDERALLRTLAVLPVIVGGTCAVLAATIFVKGSKALYLHLIPWYYGLAGSVVFGAIVAAVLIVCSPRLKRRMLSRMHEEYDARSGNSGNEVASATASAAQCDEDIVSSTSTGRNGNSDEQQPESTVASSYIFPVASTVSMSGLDDEQTGNEVDDERTAGDNNRQSVDNMTNEDDDDDDDDSEPYHQTPSDRVFAGLQILCSALTSFSHGSNDVSNAIGPLSAIFMVYSAGSIEAALNATMPWYILAIGAGGIVLGLALFGSRVIETVGVKLTKNQMRPHQGFVSQLFGASIVMLCSKFGLPVSTTNSIVGAVVGVGLMDSAGSVHRQHGADTGSVSWGLLSNIVLSWLVTLPISAILTSGFFSFLRWTL